jgi:hypothetical protein
VPHKNDLGLGRRIALAFVDQELSDEYDTVAGFFGRRGAYSRFKALLHARGMLERWYEFENRAMEEALLTWCEENGIQPVDGWSRAVSGLPQTPSSRQCSCWAFQCLLKIGTGQCVDFGMQFEWLVRRPLAYDFGQIVR